MDFQDFSEIFTETVDFLEMAGTIANMANDSDQEIAREEVARILQVTTRTVYTYEKNGTIPQGRVINRRRDKRWLRSDIERVAAALPPL